MTIVQLNDYRLPSLNGCGGLGPVNLALSGGDACSVSSDAPRHARLLIRALATLARPESGTYRFKGEVLDFSDYRNLLPVKRRIGHIAADAAMIRHISVQENILLGRFYHENSLSATPDPRTLDLCERLGVLDKLHSKPADLNVTDVRLAVAVRELAKSPDIVLLERPEDFAENRKFHDFLAVLEDIRAAGTPVVCLSYRNSFIGEFANKCIRIRRGRLDLDAATDACDARPWM